MHRFNKIAASEEAAFFIGALVLFHVIMKNPSGSFLCRKPALYGGDINLRIFKP
jgi:hypothetical protein